MNSFGRIFRVSIFGESHGNAIGVLLDGVKPGIYLTSDDFTEPLARRKPSKYGTTRIEDDVVQIKSGVFNDYTTGAPILLEITNNNIKSKDYENLKYHFRPGHADFVANVKYKGYNDYRGGGTFSGRLTAVLVCAGVVAEKIKKFDVSSSIVKISDETNPLNFDKILDEVKSNNDSVGGIVRVTVKNPNIGLGEPYFDSVESYISHLMFSVPAVKGVCFGDALNTNLLGSEFNDLILDSSGKTKTNHNGGINGGISNGNDIVINVMVKPTPSIYKPQNTYNFKSNRVEELVIDGRHDCAIILRLPVILEAVTKIALTDLYLLNKVGDIND